MWFVNPAFLWAFGLLAIPLIIHLFHFRRYKRVYFPSLKKLQELNREKKSVKSLKRWIILLLRLLAFTALILVFAQPFFLKDQEKSIPGIPVTAIYIDNSYSMSAKGTEGTLFSESKELAKKLIERSDKSTKILLYSNLLSGKERFLQSKSNALKYLEELELYRVPRSLTEVLNWQNGFLKRYNNEQERIGKTDVFLLSDFQKSTATLSKISANHPADLHLIQNTVQKANNLFIDSLWFSNPLFKKGSPLEIKFRVKNFGLKDAVDIPITIGFGNQKRMTNVDVKANASGYGNVFFTIQDYGPIEGKISLSDQQITFDDDYYFTCNIAKTGLVLCINGENASDRVNKVYETEPYYTFKAYSEGNVQQREINQADLVILNGINNLPSGLSLQLSSYIGKGGNVFIICGDSLNESSYNDFLTKMNMPMLGKPMRSGTQLAQIDQQNPFFKGMFDKVQKNFNLPLVSKTYALKDMTQKGTEVLLKMRNNLPLLIKHKKQGHVFLLAAPIQTRFGSFTDHALFPSLLLRAAEISLRQLLPYYTIGKSEGFSVFRGPQQEAPVLLRNKQKDRIPRQVNEGENTRISLNSYQTNETLFEGIFQLINIPSPLKIALNVDRIESQISYMERSQLKDQFIRQGITKVSYTPMNDGAENTMARVEKPNSLWKYLVFFALLFFLLEMALIKFWKA
ncbi:MAG: BatA domain-containing protein [Flavobacteriales bacterium]